MKKRKLHWSILWLLQWLVSLSAAVLVALSLWVGGTLHRALQWGLLPIVGCATAYFATLLGLNNYLAWIAPPTALALGHIFIWFYLPSAGPVLLCALISLVGAAAGEVMKQRRQKK